MDKQFSIDLMVPSFARRKVDVRLFQSLIIEYDGVRNAIVRPLGTTELLVSAKQMFYDYNSDDISRH